MTKPPEVAANRIGWLAVRHREKWWVGTDAGVTCYRDRMLARAALTILWQREGGGELKYRVERFTGADVDAGEHEPKYSFDEAMERYEKET